MRSLATTRVRRSTPAARRGAASTEERPRPPPWRAGRMYRPCPARPTDDAVAMCVAGGPGIEDIGRPWTPIKMCSIRGVQRILRAVDLDGGDGTMTSPTGTPGQYDLFLSHGTPDKSWV